MASEPAPGRLGRYVTTVAGGEAVRAFVPPPLPPDPPLQLEGLVGLVEEASRALGRLDGVTSILPDPPLFVYMYVRKEALLSSQIEGTQSSLSELLLFEDEELPGAPLDDVLEVSNYVAAMNHGLARLRGGFPLSLRLIREIHAVLLARGRGSDKAPGAFRRSQNRVGGSRPGNALYVPPPPQMVTGLMSALESFLHADTPGIPLLVKAGLAHHQFESIHPFLDGNGRLGRLLITFLLCAAGALREPTLYLSLYFKTQRRRYYDLLQEVRERGTWESWLAFFLEGVRDTSVQAADTARRILSLFEEDQARIEKLGRAAASALRLHQLLQTRPTTSIPAAARHLRLSPPTVRNAAAQLVRLGILRETTGRRRGQRFAYERYLGILNEGTKG